MLTLTHTRIGGAALGRSRASGTQAPRPLLARATAGPARRLVVVRGAPSGAVNEEATQPGKESEAGALPQPESEGANPYEVAQTGRTAPMSEDKHADTPEQGAAPEGDRAIQGQAWQPTQQDGETPEDRYGSAEAAQEAMEASKDRSRKSEKQTGDMDGNYGQGSA